MCMERIFDEIPEPTEEELTRLTAEEYLDAIGEGDDPKEAARMLGVRRADLLSEIEGQVVVIGELIDDYHTRPDEGLAIAIEEAKIALGDMLVEKGDLPPQ